MSWLDEIRRLDLTTVAAAGGLRLEARGLVPCPACGADQRGSSDTRAPVGLTPDGAGWRCFRCGVGGDAISLVAVLAVGDPRPPAWHDVRAWAAARGLCTGDGMPSPAARTLVREVPRPPPSPPRRPPRDEILTLWAACEPITSDSRIVGYLAERRIDAGLVEFLDLARVLPWRSHTPKWAMTGWSPWSASGHRLIVPVFDASGALVSVRARSIRSESKKKELAPCAGPGSAAGLVMAESLGRLMLQGERLADGSPASDAVRAWGVRVAEGVPDFLTLATLESDAAEDPPATLGIFSGSWTAEVAARIPDGAAVTIAKHDDDAGARFAAKIADSLSARCSVRIVTSWEAAA